MGKNIYIAHRGLYSHTIPENSLPAFALAMAEDMPIELDVQLSADNKVVVFHDRNLKRMAKVAKDIAKCKYEELEKINLQNTSEKIPLLEDVLKLVAGKVFLDIEIKHYSSWKKTTKAVREVLQNYSGAYSIKSFNPLIPYLYKKICPNIACGVLVGNLDKSRLPKFIKKILLELKYLKFYKPDFVAYNIDIINDNIIKKLNHQNIPLHLYTINTYEKLKKGQALSDILIIENMPKKD